MKNLLWWQSIERAECANTDYSNPLRRVICSQVQTIKPFPLFDLDSKGHHDGTSLVNKDESDLAAHLYVQL